MQAASNNFSEAISGSSVTWAPPRVFADWDRTGYGADGTIDDLSAQVGDSFTVAHHLDDGLPEQVSFVSGVGSPTLEAPLEYGRTDYGQTNRRASTYFSPYNTTSPVSGFDRDVAPVKLDWGVITKAGPEHVRLFTGQMMNIPVKGQGAELQSMSATRNKLRKLIQPYSVEGVSTGLNASWPVSYALAQCGVNPSPPPRVGCRWWLPMHGSQAPMIPAKKSPTQLWLPFYTVRNAGEAAAHGERPAFVPGPFLLAANGVCTTTKLRQTAMTRAEFGAGTDLLSKAGNRGRLEFWVKGDPADTSVFFPSGSPSLASLIIKNKTADTGEIYAGVKSNRKAFITISDGTGTNWSVESADTLPTDGGWYFVGVAWDIAGGRMWVTDFAGGYKGYAPTTVTTFLPNADNYTADTNSASHPYPQWVSLLPVAEIQVTSGPTADPTVYPWLNDPTYWTPQVVMRPSGLELEALTETEPREAWEFIGSFAQAELATMRTDELDRFNYLPMGYWAEPAQQVAVDAYSTSMNMSDIDIDADPSKIYNSISVSYTDTRTDRIRDALYAATVVDPIPPGVTVRRLVLSKPATYVDPMQIFCLRDIDFPVWDDPARSFVTLNTASDGSGTYATNSEVFVILTAWDPGSAEITFTNKMGATVYFVNSSNVPTLQLTGLAVETATGSVVMSDQPSIDRRGERGLAITLSAIQRRSDAQAIANELAVRLAKPRPVIADVTLFPDPRRQPGDLVTLTDEVNTMASGLWRTQSITHTRSGDDYTQTATLRKAMLVGRWDVDTWDDFIWGP